MDLQIFQDFFRSKGYGIAERIAYGVENEFPVLVQYLSNKQWRITVTGNIAQPGILQGKLAIQFAKRTASKILCRPDCASFTLVFHGENIDEMYGYSLAVVFQCFSQCNVIPLVYCPFCGKDHCDALCMVQDRYAPVHENCAVQAFPPATYTEESHMPSAPSGNYITGIIGALLGLFIGGIPQFAAYYFLEYSLAILYLLPPLLGFWGYKLLKGPDTSTGRIICTVLSAVAAPLIALLCVLSAIASQGFTFSMSFSLLPLLMRQSEFAFAFVLEYVYCIIFTILGIFIGWRRIFSSQPAPAETFHNQLITLRRNTPKEESHL